MRIVYLVCVALALVSLPFRTPAQLTPSKLDAIRQQLRLLESTQADVTSILSPGSFSAWPVADPYTFYREDETITVTYSSGKCDEIDEDWQVLLDDIWNVSKGTLIGIDIQPKERLIAKELGIDLSGFKKERVFRSHKNHHIYFDKNAGIAVFAWGDVVDSIRLFPSRSFKSKLCDIPSIKKYFLSNKWRIRPEPRHQVVDFNWPPKVVDLQLTNTDPRHISVVVTAEDPENDVLVYLYKVSGGHIVGTGSKVVWDLGDVSPGTYTIVAAVDDGMGPKGRYLTKSVTIP